MLRFGVKASTGKGREFPQSQQSPRQGALGLSWCWQGLAALSEGPYGTDSGVRPAVDRLGWEDGN